MSTVHKFRSLRVKHNLKNAQENPKQTSGALHGVLLDHENNRLKDGEETLDTSTPQTSQATVPTKAARDKGLERILNQPYARGERKKAEEVLDLLNNSEKRIILPVEPDLKGLGAINKGGVTCWLDSLVFAMFGYLDNFESMITRDFPDKPRERLALMLRLYVNLLRTGRLITTDITKQLQLAIAACGWKEAAKDDQQDASEAYSFITDQLELPMLTLKMDLFHSGKEDTDSDHKLVHERVIEVPVPEEPDDKSHIALEDCLTAYFDNRVEVNRVQQMRRNTLSSMRSGISDEKGQSLHVEVTAVNDSEPSTPQAVNGEDTTFPFLPIRPAAHRPRMPSIITTIQDPEKGELANSPSPLTPNDPTASIKRAGSFKKEVTVSAWQFFNLIPWNNPTDGSAQPPNSNAEVAALLSNRPIVPVALKRSQMDNGNSVRRDSFIDIPLIYDMPHFAKDDSLPGNDPLHDRFVLVLQSFLCHRGESTNNGHYVSAARSRNLGGAQDQWLKMDDVAKERISYIPDIRKFLDREQPYLLFYRVEPIIGWPTVSEPNILEPTSSEPPLYQETAGKDSGVAGLNYTRWQSSRSQNEEAVIVRRQSIDSTLSETKRGRSSLSEDRRLNLVLADSSAEHTKAASISLIADAGKSTSSLSRRGSKVSHNGSSVERNSQGKNKRSSVSLSRVAGKLSKEKSTPSLGGGESTAARSTGSTQPPTSDGPKPMEISRPLDRLNNHAMIGARHGILMKPRNEKGERECTLM